MSNDNRGLILPYRHLFWSFKSELFGVNRQTVQYDKSHIQRIPTAQILRPVATHKQFFFWEPQQAITISN